MSYELDIREELIIQNVNGRTREAAEMLAAYIRQFDRMDGLSGMQIYSMELEADGKIAYVDDEISSKECGYIFTDSAEGNPLVKLVEEDYSHWDDEEDVAVILAGLTDARKIILRMDCSLQVASETSYGVAFWQEFLQGKEPEGFGENVNYRSAEFYTVEEPVCCYSYQNGRGQTHKFEAIVGGGEAGGGSDAVDGAEAGNRLDALNGRSWYSYCLKLEFDGEGGKFAAEEIRSKLGDMIDEFSAKYDLETTWETMQMDAEIEAVEAGPDSTAGECFAMTEELGLLAGEDDAFLAELQKMADFAGTCGGEFRLRGEFFADNGDFAFMSIGADNGKVRAKYCSF